MITTLHATDDADIDIGFKGNNSYSLLLSEAKSRNKEMDVKYLELPLLFTGILNIVSISRKNSIIAWIKQ
jgi:hypothetical protein